MYIYTNCRPRWRRDESHLALLLNKNNNILYVNAIHTPFEMWHPRLLKLTFDLGVSDAMGWTKIIVHMLMACYATKNVCVVAQWIREKNIVSNRLSVETCEDISIHKNYTDQKLEGVTLRLINKINTIEFYECTSKSNCSLWLLTECVPRMHVIGKHPGKAQRHTYQIVVILLQWNYILIISDIYGKIDNFLLHLTKNFKLS